MQPVHRRSAAVGTLHFPESQDCSTVMAIPGHLDASFGSFGDELRPVSSLKLIGRARASLRDASSTIEKDTVSLSVAFRAFSARSSSTAGLKHSISVLRERANIASAALRNTVIRRSPLANRANQSPFARCIPKSSLKSIAPLTQLRGDMQFIIPVTSEEN